MPTPATLDGPGELVAGLPSLLGYTPRGCVVVVGVGAAEELTTVLRIDRSDLVRPDVAPRLGRSVASRLVRSRARLAVMVSFPNDDVRLSCPAIDALRPSLDGAVEEAEGWAVRGDRYFAPGCARESCCPTGGRRVPPAPPSLGARPRVRAEAHGALAAAPDAAYSVDEAARRRVARAGERWWRHRDADPAEWRATSFAAWRIAVEGISREVVPGDPESGRLAVAFQDRRVRDAVLVSLLPGWESLAPRVLEGARDEEVARALRVLLAPGDGRPPERDSVELVWGSVCG